MRRAARTARSASSSWRDGSAEGGHDGVPDELLHGAAPPHELSSDAGVVRPQRGSGCPRDPLDPIARRSRQGRRTGSTRLSALPSARGRESRVTAGHPMATSRSQPPQDARGLSWPSWAGRAKCHGRGEARSSGRVLKRGPGHHRPCRLSDRRRARAEGEPYPSTRTRSVSRQIASDWAVRETIWFVSFIVLRGIGLRQTLSRPRPTALSPSTCSPNVPPPLLARNGRIPGGRSQAPGKADAPAQGSEEGRDPVTPLSSVR